MTVTGRAPNYKPEVEMNWEQIEGKWKQYSGKVQEKWGKLTDDRTNANQTTSQALTDIGAGATFYDNLVEVRSTQA